MIRARGYSVRVDETKTAAGRRTIPLPRFAIETLRLGGASPTSVSRP